MQVVYLLALIRKLLEAEETKQTFPDLWFHCSWAFHSRMRLKEAQKVVADFEAAHLEALQSKSRPMTDLSDPVREAVQHRMLYSNFQTELDGFLVQHSLPNAVATEPDLLGNFLSLYTDAIAGVLLQILNPAIKGAVSAPPTVHVSLMVAKKAREEIATVPGKLSLFGTKWAVTFDEKDYYCWTVDYLLNANAVRPSSGAAIVKL